MFCKSVLIAVFAAVFCQLSQGKPNEKPDYTGCDADYQCFGLPKDCLKDKSCEALLRTQAQQKTGEVDFELFWVRDSKSTNSWVAAALSADSMMNNDSATVFMIGSDGKVTYEQGLTFVNKDKHGNVTGAGVKPETVKGIKVHKTSYKNGMLQAKWSRPQTTTVEKLTFDMKATKYYIFLARGPVKDGKLHHHTGLAMTAESVDLEHVGSVSKATTAKSVTTASPSTAKPATPSAKPSTKPPTHAPSTQKAGSTAAPPSTTPHTAGPTSNTTDTPHSGSSSNTTESGKPTGKPTGHPTHHPTTAKPSKGDAHTITMSLFLTIFAAILLFLN